VNDPIAGCRQHVFPSRIAAVSADLPEALALGEAGFDATTLDGVYSKTA
jgi:hypothetical protein